MWRATLSSLLAHKVRLALTTLAIVFGVAFIAGTLIYTDTTRSTFDSVFGQITGSVDFSVRGISQLDDAEGGDQFEIDRPTVPAEVADRVAAVDGVTGIERNVEGVIGLLGADGQPLGSGQGPPSLGFNAPTVDDLSPTELRDGRYPSAADEVALDAATAGDNGFAVGDTVQIAVDGPIAEYEVVGTFGFGAGVDNLAGASVTLFDPDTAFELFADDGGYSSIDVLAADGARLDDLQDAVAAAAGDAYEVVTSDELAGEAQEAIDTVLGFLGNALLVFAGVSLLVGAFLINNTFAIIVAQRSRELALLRAVGASRAQVLGSVLLEAAVVGTFASAVGVGVGVLVAMALQQLLVAFGIDIPAGDLVFATRTVVVGMSVGIIITLLSALLPAIRALKVPPVAAMRTIAVGDQQGGGRIRTVLGVLLTTAGLGMLGAGLFGAASFAVVIGGAVALLLGVALLTRYVTRPLLRLVGWPLSRLGIRGALAQGERHPQSAAHRVDRVGVDDRPRAGHVRPDLRGVAARVGDGDDRRAVRVRPAGAHDQLRELPRRGRRRGQRAALGRHIGRHAQRSDRRARACRRRRGHRA